MYYDDENNKCLTDAELYNLTDDVSKLSQTYSVGCHDKFVEHTQKAYRGFWITLLSVGATGLIGGLYTLIHHGAAQYYSGAEDVYRKYSDLVTDIDDLQDEWRDMDPETRHQISRFQK